MSYPSLVVVEEELVGPRSGKILSAGIGLHGGKTRCFTTGTSTGDRRETHRGTPGKRRRKRETSRRRLHVTGDETGEWENEGNTTQSRRKREREPAEIGDTQQHGVGDPPGNGIGKTSAGDGNAQHGNAAAHGHGAVGNKNGDTRRRSIGDPPRHGDGNKHDTATSGWKQRG